MERNPVCSEFSFTPSPTRSVNAIVFTRDVRWSGIEKVYSELKEELEERMREISSILSSDKSIRRWSAAESVRQGRVEVPHSG